MHRHCMRYLLQISLVVLGVNAVLAATPQNFALPDHGTLTLKVPDGWTAMQMHPNRLPITIALTPHLGPMFELQVSAIWPVSSTAGLTDETTLRSEVAAAAKDAESQSVEHALQLKELTGTDGHGYYFFATDRAPNPGEYKYMTMGMIRTGETALAFTLLTNDGQDAVIRAALDVIRGAVHRAGGAG